jgi:DNA-binding PadR family transcriptional regulator
MNDLKKLSPLTEVTYYILLSVIEPLHGYGIIKKVEKMSNHRLSIAAGSLYGAISSLLENQCIIQIQTPQEDRRKLYQITDKGRMLLHYEIQRLSEMVRNGQEEMRERQ